MNSALLVVDADGRIAACNPPAEQILGEQAEQLRGRSLRRWFASEAPARMHRAQPRPRASASAAPRHHHALRRDLRPDRHLLRAPIWKRTACASGWWPPSRI